MLFLSIIMRNWTVMQTDIYFVLVRKAFTGLIYRKLMKLS